MRVGAEQRTRRTLGAPLGGVLQDYVVFPAEDAVGALGVLVKGTAGVVIFAMQFAKLAGATVVLTWSSSGLRPGDASTRIC